MKRCIVTLRPLTAGLKVFDVVVYGRSARDLMTVPNDVVSSLARRYPDYHSTLFDVRPL